MAKAKKKKTSKKKTAKKKTAKKKAPKKTKSKDTCAQSRCRREAVSEGYCRLHYITNWKTIKFDKHVKAEQRLNSYVDRLVKKYPEEYLEKIKEALESEEKFIETIEELDLEVETDNNETDREYLEKFSRNIKAGE